MSADQESKEVFNADAAQALGHKGGAFDFQYPDETTLEAKASELAQNQTSDFVYKLTAYLLSVREPRLALLCLCYLSRFDMTQLIKVKDNSVAEFARAWGISTQKMYCNLQRTAKRLGLRYRTVKGDYKDTNYRPL